MANGDNPEENVRAAAQLAEILEKTLGLHARRAAALRTELSVLEQQRGLADKGRLIVQKNLELKRNELQAEQQVLEKMQGQVGEYQRLQNLSARTTEQEEKRLQLQKLIESGLQDEINARTADLQLRRQQHQASENTISATQRAVRTTLGISDAWKKSLVGSLAFGGSLKDVSAGLQSSINASNVIMSTWMKIAEISMKAGLEYDSMSAGLRQIAGGAAGMDDLARQTYAVHRANIQFGMGIKESGEATSSLYSSMASFSHMLPGTSMALQRQVGLLKQVGVDSQTTAQALNFMDKGLRMSTSDSIALTNKLFGLAKSLKVPPTVIFRDWQAASSELAKYGAGMEQVFIGLSAQAKNTGLAMGQLLGIAKQYDEFDSAGQAVGRLNAMLGGPYLNAIQMVYMTETERIGALREVISLSGAAWTSLSRHERQAYAAAAGIRDMAVAAQLFGGSSREFAQAAADQAALEKRAKESQSAMRKLQMAAYGLAVAIEPLVSLVSALAGGLAQIASYSGVTKVLSSLLFVVGPLTVKFMAWRRAVQAQNAVIQMGTALTSLNATATTALARAEDIASGATSRFTLQQRLLMGQVELTTGGLVRQTSAISGAGAGASQATPAIRGLTMSTRALMGSVATGIGAFAGMNAMLKGTKGYAGDATAAIGGLAIATMALKWAPMLAALGAAAPFVAAAGLGVAAAGIYSSVVKAQSTPRREAGGPVQAGQPYLVGETGRETYVPAQNGTIVNNADTENMLGGAGGAGMGELRDALVNLSMRLDNVGQAGGGSQQPIVIELDGNAVGEFAVGKVNEQLGVLS